MRRPFLALLLLLGSALAVRAAEPLAEKAAALNEAEKTKANVEKHLNPKSKLVAAIVAAVPDGLSAVPKQRRKVLVVMGWESPLHDAGKAGLLVVLREAARRFNAFELTECYDCSAVTAEMLKQYDAVVLNNTHNTYRKEVTVPFNASLEAYVKAGGGFFANHGSAHSGKPISQLLGLKNYGWAGKFAGVPFPVRIVEPSNPLMAGFRAEITPRAWTYYYPDGNGTRTAGSKVLQLPREFVDELNTATLDTTDGADPSRVLLTLDMENLPKELSDVREKFAQSPLSWTRRHGQGRVFFSEFAHFGECFTIPAMNRSMLDGLQYVVGDLTVDEEHDYDDEAATATREALQTYLDPAVKGYRTRFEDDDIEAERLAIIASLPAKLSVPVESKRRILVITCNIDIHVAGAAGFLYFLRAAEKKYGAFELVEVNTIKGLDAAVLGGYDVIILNNFTKTWCEEDEVLLARKPELKEALNRYYKDMKNPALKIRHSAAQVERFNRFKTELLPSYLKNGGGVLALHASLQPFGGEWLGGAYGGHPQGTLGYRGGKANWDKGYGVRLVEPDNPLAKAFRDAPGTRLTSELYQFAPGSNTDRENPTRPIVSMDFSTYPQELYATPADDFVSALITIKSHGKGRVYYSAIGGHQWKPYAVPAFSRALLDGIQYLAGDLNVPPAPAAAAPAAAAAHAPGPR